jgi:hypothetical protein
MAQYRHWPTGIVRVCPAASTNGGLGIPAAAVAAEMALNLKKSLRLKFIFKPPPQYSFSFDGEGWEIMI